MGDYILSCCSTADLTREQLDKKGIKHICFHFELDGRTYPDDLGVSMPFGDFYDAMANGLMTKTSQVSVGEYTDYFEEFLKNGKDILHLTLSSGISGTYNSAMIAKSDLEEKYPDRKIYVIDSMAASGGYGLLMTTLADKKNAGMGIDELSEWAENNKLKMQHWFFTSDLTYLIRGGRVSKASGFVGSLLNICPLLNVDYEGKLAPRMKVRTKKKVIVETVNKMKEHAENGTDYSGEVLITQAECYGDAEEVANQIKSSFKNINGDVVINYIGTTIGAHTGPGTVALFFWGDKRVD